MASTSKANYYDILRVDPQAEKDEIRDAYRRLALLRHPDKNRGRDCAVAEFQEVRSLNFMALGLRKER